VELPFVAGSWEGFETAFGEGDFQERFHRGTGATTSEVDGPELNKSNTHARAQPEPPPLILTFTEEVFSMMLTPEDCELNFLLGFTALASTTPEQRSDPPNKTASSRVSVSQ
jgi:hypothetical protein